MGKYIKTVALFLSILLPITVTAYNQLKDGVYQDGSTLYITSEVTSVEGLNLNPSIIYSFGMTPPICDENSFDGYSAILHVPASAMTAYFVAPYWCNFANTVSDAVEPQSLTLTQDTIEIELNNQASISGSISPINAFPNLVMWSSSDLTVATVIGGNITPIAIGECDIIASCLGLQSICHVKVVGQKITISLDQHEASILPTHLLSLTPTLSPTTVDLVATSSDLSVAIPRVNNGVVQVVGVKEGVATITVNTIDGNAHTDSCVVNVYTELGDVNCDGYINISDVTTLIDYLLSNDTESISEKNADIRQDGQVNISDVTALIDILLSVVEPEEPEEPETDSDTIFVNGVSFVIVKVEGGTFMMGATEEQCNALKPNKPNDSEFPVHQVTLSSYSIGQTEVTQALWKAVMGSNPSGHTGNLQFPVERVTWSDCEYFIIKLNQLTGMNFRFPTEAEWEFAARGGNKSQGYVYSGSNRPNDVCWDNASSNMGQGCMSQPVGIKAPNELGLYDMSGNVKEWCQDWFSGSYYSVSPSSNPTGPSSGSNHVVRGGSWNTSAIVSCRVSSRGTTISSTYLFNDCGLRLAL